VNFVPITERDQQAMLAAAGVDAFERLLSIPPGIPRAKWNLPKGLSEPELTGLLTGQAARNRTVRTEVSFLGAGATEHWIPSVVRYLFSRGEFLTAYTPYQPEASQGTLQAMYEFQSMICDLTGMAVANASLYEGASALAEAVVLALRATGRNRVAISRTVHPEYRQTLKTYLAGSEAALDLLPHRDGAVDPAAESKITDQTACLVLQLPNAFGCIEEWAALIRKAKAQGALVIVSADPIALSVVRPPAEIGADIVVGEGQALGTPLLYGGPYLGLFACREELLRRLPGRIVGRTRDANGRRGFVLTIQTREQHIRRSRATSNICTNEAMMALNAAVYLAALGKSGFRELGVQNLSKARYAHQTLTALPGVEPLFDRPFFNEFALSLPKDPEQVNAELLKRGFLGGLALKRWDPKLANGWLVCVTEARSKEQIDRFAEALREILR